MMYGADTWAVKKAQEKKLDTCGGNQDVKMDEWSRSSGRFRGGPGGPGPPLLKIPKMKKRVPPVENPKNAKDNK